MSAPARRRSPPTQPRERVLTAALAGAILALSAGPWLCFPPPRPSRPVGDVALDLAPSPRGVRPSVFDELRWEDGSKPRPIIYKDPLRWLERRQESDGSWRSEAPGRSLRATAFGILAFLREGGEARGHHPELIRDGLRWIMRKIGRAPKGPDRDLAALALAEGFARTRWSWLKAPARWALMRPGSSGWIRRARRIGMKCGLLPPNITPTISGPAPDLPFHDAAILASDRPENARRRERWLARSVELGRVDRSCCGTSSPYWPDQGPELTPAGAVEATAKALWLRQADKAYRPGFWSPL